jgi:hypothetical protein
MGDTVLIETTADEVVSIVTVGPQGPSGSEAATLTTTGDLLYRAALANDRLPIGSEGQVLKVASGLPAWGNESGSVTSVAGRTGAVTLAVADVANAVSDSDSRLTDARTPTSHTHGNLSNDGKIGTTSGLPLKTGTAGAVEAGAFGTGAGEFCAGDDARLSDDRNPLSHAASHAAAGSDPVFDQDLDTTDNVAFNSVGFGGDFTVDAVGLNWAGQNVFEVETNTFYDQSGNTAFTVGTVCEFAKKIRLTNTADLSAAVELDADSVSTLTTRSIAFPDASGTIALTSDLHTRSHAITSTSDHTAGNHKVFYSNGSGEVVELALGDSGKILQSNGASAAPTWETPASGGIGGGTGSTDNAILRADGTGGSTAQGSALQLDDFTTSTQNNVTLRVRQGKFAFTADASTDVITATGHNFSNNDRVSFSEMVGGAGLNAAVTYFVRDLSGDTFKVSTSSGGTAVNITTNYTGGNVELIAALVLTTPNMAQFIVGPKPDGTTHGGNARGEAAIDIQPARSGNSATAVASGFGAVAMGNNCTASGTRSVAIGGSATATGIYATVVGAYNNSATARNGAVFGGTSALADRSLRAYCAHSNSALGHRQELQAFMSQTTTNDTPTEMFLDEYNNLRLTVPSGKVMGGIVCVVGSRSTGADVALYTRQFVIKNVGGTTTLLSSSTIGTDYEDVAGTDITVEANDTNDALRVLVTGVASQNWRWTGWVHATEHYYGT